MREYNYRIQPLLNVCEGLYKLYIYICIYVYIYIYIWGDYHTVLENRVYYTCLLVPIPERQLN